MSTMLRSSLSTTTKFGPRQLRAAVPRSSVAPKAIFDFFKQKQPAAKAAIARPIRPTVIPEPSYNLQVALLAIAGVSAYEGVTPLALIAGILGVFLTIQAKRVKFVFDDDSLEVIVGGQESDNKFVGGLNRWKYDSFVNWELWWPNFPVLVYFKETQTKPEGQIHFFPVIFDGKAIYKVMVERCGPSKTSGPKSSLPVESYEEDE